MQATLTQAPRNSLLQSFMQGFKHVSRKRCNKHAKKMRATLSEETIDSMIEDSFPASDPPSTY